MPIIDELADSTVWERFVAQKEDGGNTPDFELKHLKRYVQSKDYVDVVQSIRNGGDIPIPKKKLLEKEGSTKKRTVYVFPDKENMVLKLMTYLLIRKYDYLFAPNLYSFRAGTGAQIAVKQLTAKRGISNMYSYKVDISDYFNSIDVSLLLPMLKNILKGDEEIYSYFEKQLTDQRVLDNKKIKTEQKGIMAGCPTAAFLANVYLRSLDAEFERRRIIYARYSDDIIVFTKTEAERAEAEKLIKDRLAAFRLKVNEKKEFRTSPGEKWTFLGFSYVNGKIDIAETSVVKLKAKMRRKSMALLRWKRRKKLANKFAARAFVKLFNRKLYENTAGGEITWTRWYYPIINTDESLKILDAYMQDCIRYILTEKRTKKRFDINYEDIKALGYRNLVHEYWELKKQAKEEIEP